MPRCFLILLLVLINYGCRNDGDYKSRNSITKNFISFPDSKKADPSWSAKNEVIYHITADPGTLHPTNGNTSIRSFIFNLTQKYLFGRDYEKLELRPDLVKEIPEAAKDRLTYRIILRKGITWDNGEPLTAEDVVFTIKANKCPLVNNSPLKPYVNNIAEVIADRNDRLVCTLIFKKPSLQDIFPLIYLPVMQRSFHDPGNILSSYSMKTLDDTAFAKTAPEKLKRWAEFFNGAEFGFETAKLNGLGAYKVVSWEQGQELILERKKSHWSFGKDHSSSVQAPYDEALPERIIFKISSDRNAVILNFKSQLIDGSNSISHQTITELLGDSSFKRNYHSAGTDIFGYSYLVFNMKADGIKHPRLFTDKRVRKALALLIPAEQISMLSNGTEKQTRMAGPVFTSSDEFNTALKPVPFDPEKAKQLLAEAGWKDSDKDGLLDKVIDGKKTPFRFTITYMNTPAWKDIILIIAESYQAAGILMEMKPMELNLVFQKAAEHDFDMLASGTITDFSRLDFAQMWHTDSWHANGANFSGFGTSYTDALIDSSNTATEIDERIYYSRKLQEIIYDEQPVIFLHQGKRYAVIHKRFGNAQIFKEYPHVLINRWKLLTD